MPNEQTRVVAAHPVGSKRLLIMSITLLVVLLPTRAQAQSTPFVSASVNPSTVTAGTPLTLTATCTVSAPDTVGFLSAEIAAANVNLTFNQWDVVSDTDDMHLSRSEQIPGQVPGTYIGLVTCQASPSGVFSTQQVQFVVTTTPPPPDPTASTTLPDGSTTIGGTTATTATTAAAVAGQTTTTAAAAAGQTTTTAGAATASGQNLPATGSGRAVGIAGVAAVLVGVALVFVVRRPRASSG